jgi:hypothetical protein
LRIENSIEQVLEPGHATHSQSIARDQTVRIFQIIPDLFDNLLPVTYVVITQKLKVHHYLN